MRVIRTTDSKENLCGSCPNKNDFPVCLSEDIEFGDGIGNDNIIACSQCTSKYSDTIYPAEISKTKRRMNHDRENNRMGNRNLDCVSTWYKIL